MTENFSDYTERSIIKENGFSTGSYKYYIIFNKKYLMNFFLT